MTQARTASRYELLERPALPATGDRYLLMVAILLAGYAIAGRGFAYIGIPPVFVGELTLLFGIITLFSTPHCFRMFRATQAIVLLPFMAWGLLRTVPYVAVYQLDALRDAVLWAYSIFAFFIAAVLLSDSQRLGRLLGWYDRFTKVFLCCVPFFWAGPHIFDKAIPSWPWIDQHIIQFKEGDALVQLAGIIAFWASGLGSTVNWRWMALLTFDLAICGIVDRGGLISFRFVLFLCFLLRPRSIAPWRLMSMIGAALLILAVTGINIAVAGAKDRDFSFDQIVQNVFSIGGSSDAAGLDATKEWRMQWWTDIVDYTWRGPYFWGGKGYGINLADEDGYQVGNKTLRSPHNAHMTFLARSGVIGTALWAVVQIVWGVGIWWGHLTARRRGNPRWSNLFFFIGCFWSAFLLNASFDVFLESPMGGIWFWTVYGIGIACLLMYKNQQKESRYESI